eukprot:s1277_g5.t1
MLRSPLLCGLSPFDHRGTAYRAYTKQPGGRKPPVPKVPWTPRIPGRNSSTDPTPQQMPRPDPLTPRLTRRRPCAALQRWLRNGTLATASPVVVLVLPRALELLGAPPQPLPRPSAASSHPWPATPESRFVSEMHP